MNMLKTWTEPARKQLCQAFNVSSVHAVQARHCSVQHLAAFSPIDLWCSINQHSHCDLQDILNSMLLSESVYRAYDSGPEAAAHAFRDLQRGFAPGLITVASMQCSLPHVQQR